MSPDLSWLEHRARLQNEQARIFREEHQRATAEGRDTTMPSRTPRVADYQNLRGLPTVGKRAHLARALAGAGHVDQIEQSRRQSIRRRVPTGAEEFHSNDMLNRYKNRCYLCGIGINILTMHLEHIIPIAKGGTHTTENLAPACGDCNSRKGTRFVSFMVATRKPIFSQ